MLNKWMDSEEWKAMLIAYAFVWEFAETNKQNRVRFYVQPHCSVTGSILHIFQILKMTNYGTADYT